MLILIRFWSAVRLIDLRLLPLLVLLKLGDRSLFFGTRQGVVIASNDILEPLQPAGVGHAAGATGQEEDRQGRRKAIRGS